MKFILKFLLIAGVIWLCANYIPEIQVEGYKGALIAAAVMGIINVIIKPIAQIISIPITILTLGLFYLVVNGLLVMLMDKLVDGFAVSTFWWAIGFSIIISIAGTILDKILDKAVKK